jgi:hypothetical protein
MTNPDTFPFRSNPIKSTYNPNAPVQGPKFKNVKNPNTTTPATNLASHRSGGLKGTTSAPVPGAYQGC